MTALYELVPVGVSESKPGVDPLKYQKPSQAVCIGRQRRTAYRKNPQQRTGERYRAFCRNSPSRSPKEKFSNASQDFKFAAAVAAFGMVLRDSPHKGSANLESALEWAKEGRGTDKHGYRQEFIRLVHRAISISF